MIFKGPFRPKTFCEAGLGRPGISTNKPFQYTTNTPPHTHTFPRQGARRSSPQATCDAVAGQGWGGGTG